MYVRPRPRFRPRNAGGVPFSPALLFTSGVAGAWYDPSDVLLNWRTNLLTYTQQFDNAAWTKLNATITSNAAVAPDGTTTASLVTSTGGETRVGVINSVAALNTYTASIFAKYSNSNGRYLWFRDFFASKDTCFDLLNGIVVSAPAGTTATITAQANGFYRCTTTWTTPASAVFFNQQYWVQSSSNSSVSLGTTGGEFYIWGAQLELGSTATTYQAITMPEQTYLLYDPQPVLYQDSAGTTPVTAVEQPVGLMLDKSQGLVLGAEVSPNVGGPFTSTTGFSGNQATLSVVSGKLRVTSTATGFSSAYFVASGLVPNSRYLLSFDVANVSGPGTITAAFYDTAPSSTLISSAIVNGTVSCILLTSSDGEGAFNILFAPTAIGQQIDIGRLSVKSLPGNHASQATAASRPVLRARYNLLTYSNQADNAAWTKSNSFVQTNLLLNSDTLATQNVTTAATPYTLSFYGTGTVTLSGTSTAGPLVGTGAANRVTLTFTPTAGTLTLTVTGSVTQGQLVQGSVPGDYRATTSAALPVLYADYNGALRARKLCESAINALHINLQIPTVNASTVYTLSEILKAGERTKAALLDGAGSGAIVIFDLQAGTIVSQTNATGTITSAGNGYYRCSATMTTGVAQTSLNWRIATVDAANNTTYAGDGSSGIYIADAQLWQGSVPGNYQNINAATDYATAGFLPYLYFVTDDSFGTNSIDFTATDKMSVCAGVTKLSDAAVGVIAELSTSAGGGTSGTFVLHTQTSPVGYRYAAGSGASGAAFATDDASTFTAPITNVITGISNFAGATINDEISVRVNGATPTQSIAGTVSTGNFGNYPLYIGRRGGASLPFNGNLYQLIVCGKELSASELASTEAYVNSKTGAN